MQFSHTAACSFSASCLIIFALQKISFSQVPMPDRGGIVEAIENYGGKYAGNMIKGHCTHLVVDNGSGRKYEVARTWGWSKVRIVTLKWVKECIARVCFFSFSNASYWFTVFRIYAVNTVNFIKKCYCSRKSVKKLCVFHVITFSGKLLFQHFVLSDSFVSI